MVLSVASEGGWGELYPLSLAELALKGQLQT